MSSGSIPVGAPSMAARARSGISSPAKITSRLSAKYRKKVRVVRPARAVICGTVVAW
ncbi:hypothetical protein Q9Q99_07625 [Curtobacterium flaccumfaciens]|nr:hypothetical protein Q9Q99_07625 [Curtobacterium flaccumfaciens]